mmetsp:Transcript_3421/g.6923  ORF Transcript_3421/g.6923 Transcript_3421/m.6923 type:complete len:199 (+) Transcript_3421:1-597(+)
MRVFALLSMSAVVAASGFPTPAKFTPLIDACKGVGELSNCSAHYEGVCKTDKSDGTRFCGHAHCAGKSGIWKALKGVTRAVKKQFGMHGHHKSHWPRLLGDCGSKEDGEKCSSVREGRCVDGGKCPIFHGQMVCKPWGMRPPEFVTKPCEGKSAGSSCSLAILSGKCEKAKYDDFLVCKTWPFQKVEQEDTPTVDLVV